MKSSIAYWHTAYTGFHLDFNEVVYSANAVAIRWTMRGTSRSAGSTPGMEKDIDVPGISILHISDGKFTDECMSGDDLTWFKQRSYTLVATSPSKSAHLQKIE